MHITLLPIRIISESRLESQKLKLIKSIDKSKTIYFYFTYLTDKHFWLIHLEEVKRDKKI